MLPDSLKAFKSLSFIKSQKSCKKNCPMYSQARTLLLLVPRNEGQFLANTALKLGKSKSYDGFRFAQSFF
jgi:hypothetical protein